MQLADVFGFFSLAEIVGYVGNVVVIVTYSMRTMIPLRMLGMCSNAVFLFYSWLLGLVPLMILQCILLPLNGYRLYQMLRLTKQVQSAAEGDGSMSWLKPFMTKRNCRAGEELFHRGAVAEEMFFTVSGRYRLVESGIELGTGQVVGELGAGSAPHADPALRGSGGNAGDFLLRREAALLSEPGIRLLLPAPGNRAAVPQSARSGSETRGARGIAGGHGRAGFGVRLAIGTGVLVCVSLVPACDCD
jgi:hypothetical protein